MPDKFLARLEQVEAFEDLQDLIVELRDFYGVSHLVYHWVSANGEQYGCGTYPAEWVQTYIDNDYLRIDPVVLGCYQRFHPVDWRKLDWSSKASKALAADAARFQIGTQGFSIPIRGPNGQFALFTVSDHRDDLEWDEFTRENQRNLILIAHYFNNSALMIERGRTPTPSKPLSPRETDALTFLAMGYGRGQVAEMLEISEHTLRAYIESARLKLGANNTTHAVARALAEGLIITGGATSGAVGNWPGRHEEQSKQSVA